MGDDELHIPDHGVENDPAMGGAVPQEPAIDDPASLSAIGRLEIAIGRLAGIMEIWESRAMAAERRMAEIESLVAERTKERDMLTAGLRQLRRDIASLIGDAPAADAIRPTRGDAV